MKSIQEAVASVQNAFPSIYTKDDVIKLLNSIEAPKEGNGILTQTQIEELCSRIFEHVKDNASNLDSDDVCDKESAEYELYGNEISLTSVDIDTRHIANNVVDGVGDVIETFFEDLKEDNN
jgi:hypothetical protein